MQHFRFSILFTFICLGVAAWWGFSHGPEAGINNMLKVLLITAILAVMEVSLSFDNAVVNASVLSTLGSLLENDVLNSRYFGCRVWYAVSVPRWLCCLQPQI